jgi:hypothetical protein
MNVSTATFTTLSSLPSSKLQVIMAFKCLPLLKTYYVTWHCTQKKNADKGRLAGRISL